VKYPTQNEMMTGREYLDSLNDGREVYIYGERVENVCEHRALRNSAYSMSRLYDALHDSSSQEVMTAIDSDGYRTHRYFMPSRSSQELLQARDAIAHWSRLSYGFMGRTPDYTQKPSKAASSCLKTNHRKTRHPP
jgi:4-hydroxyphenylacetate 3-monooxygenase